MNAPAVWKWATATTLYLLVSFAFSWPQVTSPFDLVVARHFDPFDAWWVAGRPFGAWINAFSDETAWPLGQSLGKADSWVMVAICSVLRPIVGPGGALAFLTLLGPVFTALATQWAAERALGARYPWSIIAGITFGFCGLSATAVLEGHVYMLFVPWMPLLVADLLAARDGSVTAARRAGLWWALCLLTSAYTGMNATFAAGMILVFGGGPKLPRPHLRSVWWFALICALAGSAYAAGFLVNTNNYRVASADAVLNTVERWQSGSASIASLLAWYPNLDLNLHSVAPCLSGVAIALAVFGVPSRGMRVLALVAAALSLGPTFRLVSGQGGFPWIFSLFADLPGVEWFRFPVRLAHLASLGLAFAAAASASTLARRAPLVTIPLLIASILEPIIIMAMPWRTMTAPAELPDAYRVAPKGWAILDLYPRFEGRGSDLDSYFGGVSCMYQSMHRQPILGRCLDTTLTGEPRTILSNWVTTRVLDPNNATEVLTNVEFANQLGKLGVGSIVLHVDAYLPGDAADLRTGLTERFGAPVVSTNGGERTEIFVNPMLSASPLSREAALTAWTNFENPA